jgi:hypothetical protein
MQEEENQKEPFEDFDPVHGSTISIAMSIVNA